MHPILKIARIDIIIAVLSGAAVACIAGALVGDLAAGALGFAVAFLTTTGRQRRRAALQVRIDSPDALQWEVVVNDILVGTLSDAHYAALEKAVFDDWRLYFAQGLNLVEVCSRAARTLLFAGPVALFWLAIAVVAFDPHGAAAIIDTVRIAPSVEVVAAVGRYVPVLAGIATVPMCLFGLVTATRFGYEDQFQAELGAAVRRSVQAAAEGRMLLVPIRALRPV